MLCPKCLLNAGLSTQAKAGVDGAVVIPGAQGLSKGHPQPGEQFGHYRMVRLLGQGGMGVVYEAEDLETGRRVALKILGQALDSPDARKRFLQEGQLAASINHPNSVYVFGTEEIAGTPVIAMELVAGGTLYDRVLKNGPMPVTEAVDSILQIINGLEAAQQIGIFHRDIKPSNCFVDGEGTVKIGDFGLSITTAVRTESNLTEAGTLFGTPAFSSPEQLRGDELTVSSDIYSVGVTLYYLLTGHVPFEAANVVKLLATVLESRPESPEKWNPNIPKGLSRLVLRCLEKNSRERFASYPKLREALLPYAKTAPTPAKLSVRFLAGCIDTSLLVSVCFQLAQILTAHGWELVGTVVFWAIILSYYSLLEGIWGTTAGKALFGLRTVNVSGNPPGLWRALFRCFVFGVVSMLGVDMVGGIVGDHLNSETMEGLMATGVWFSLLALTFTTARRRNGFAGIHDLASRTRVTSKTDHARRVTFSKESEAQPDSKMLPLIGPYHILDKVGISDDSEVLLGYDARLLRKVWIRKLPFGVPAVSTELRNLARPGRLRWLSGRRSLEESWDAYEALSGQPLLHLISKRKDWSQVRFWLFDLATEIQSSQNSSTPASLSLDRVWITADRRAKLLDFVPPGISGDLSAENRVSDIPPTGTEFLRQVASSALMGKMMTVQQACNDSISMPLPLHARSLLEELKSNADLNLIIDHLRSLLGKTTKVARMRRLGLVVAAIWFPVLMTTFVMFPDLTTAPYNRGIGFALSLTWSYTLSLVIVPGLAAALVFRGGALFRAFGIAVVRYDGKVASRGRIFLRNLITWIPFLVMPVPITIQLFGLTQEFVSNWPGPGWLVIAIPVLPTLISLMLPKRSLQDWLAGTYLVPR